MTACQRCNAAPATVTATMRRLVSAGTVREAEAGLCGPCAAIVAAEGPGITLRALVAK